MKLIFLIAFLFPLIINAQIVQYTPNRKLVKTVESSYYDTEYFYFKNSSTKEITLNFKVIESTLLPDWSATICTNKSCFNTIPNSGTFGTIAANNKAFFAFNFAANQTNGSGIVRFLITNLSSIDNNWSEAL